MGTKLVPNDVDIYEQFRRRDQFVQMVQRWNGGLPVTGFSSSQIDTARLEEDSGVRCHYVGDNIAGFELVDERAYTMFILAWA